MNSSINMIDVYVGVALVVGTRNGSRLYIQVHGCRHWRVVMKFVYNYQKDDIGPWRFWSAQIVDCGQHGFRSGGFCTSGGRG